MLNYLLQEVVNRIPKFRDKSSSGSLPSFPLPFACPRLGRVSVINIPGRQKASSKQRTCTDSPLKSLSPVPRSTGCILLILQTEAGTVGLR